MDILLTAVLPLALAFIMFSLGVGLVPADFTRVVHRPLAFLVGAANQVVMLPLVALMCIWLFQLHAEIAVGIMILAVCPGGVTSNMISKLARADLALSVSLTAVISLSSVITVPLVLALSIQGFMGDEAPNIDITATAITMFALTVVPITLGMLLRQIAPNFTPRAEPFLSTAATSLFAAIVVAAIVASWALFTTHAMAVGPALVVMLATLTAVGFLVSRLLGRSTREAKTISIETGIQNGALGIAIAAVIVGGGSVGIGPYAMPSAIYGVLMNLIIIPVVTLYRKMD